MEIRLGCLSDPIGKQLKEQGLFTTREKEFKRIGESISYLYLAGYLADSQKERLYKKLAKEIAKSAKPLDDVREE